MAKTNQFIKVDLTIAEKFGGREALLLGFLFNKSKVAKKDRRGFFGCDIAYIARGLNMSRPTVRGLCRTAADHHLIHYEPGKNQNAKPRFKIF